MVSLDLQLTFGVPKVIQFVKLPSELISQYGPFGHKWEEGKKWPKVSPRMGLDTAILGVEG